MTSTPSRRFLSPTLHAGFSLIEIVLAIGVIAVALVGILGLFPVALTIAGASQTETRATFIAQTIYNELSSNVAGKRFLLRGDDPKTSPRIEIKLDSPEEYFLAFDDQGHTLPNVLTPDKFESGTGDAGFLAKISISQDNVPEGLANIQITVDHPASAPAENRTRCKFVTLLALD